MQTLPRYLIPGLVAAFAAACIYGFRADLALISLEPLARAWDLVALAALFSLLNYGLRIVRWQRYLARLGRPLPLGFVAVTYVAGLAFTVSPGKVGEMARARYYSRFGISLSDVAGAFFVERLLDVVAMVALAALIAASAPRYHMVMWGAGVVVVAVLVVLTVLPWSRLAPSQPTRDELGTRTPLPAAVKRALTAATRALGAARSLLSPGALSWGLALGLAAWGLEGTGLYVLGSLFPAVHLAATTGIGIYAVAVLVGAVSFLPGGLGSTEAVMTALLAAQGFAVGDALLITIACRLVTLWLAVVIGWIAVFSLRRRLVPVVS